MMNSLISAKSGALKGTARIPGDKSMSHRALMLGLLTKDETMISGLLEGEDVYSTAAAMRALGAKVSSGEDGLWRVFGTGLGNIQEPSSILDMGNSGTSVRLLMGLIAGHDIAATFIGDKSLNKRPMNRVMTPLGDMGAQFISRKKGRLPLTIQGSDKLEAIEYQTPVASAQVKSAILLAGLSANGTTTVIEEKPTRDHTENMLHHFGVEVTTEKLKNGNYAVSVKGGQQLQGCAIDIPGDPSSAAFPVVAALLTEGSEIKLSNIGINPRRIGLYEVLQQMGADITFQNRRIAAGEPVADIIVKGTGPLKGIDVPPEIVPSMIDEFPVLAMAAACAEGTTRMTGLAELRVKESDRLLMVANGLKACGISLKMGEESLTINSNGKHPIGGAIIDTALDHRIAMSFLVLGSVSDEPIKIDDASPIETSFPDFTKLMNNLGTDISATDEPEILALP